MKALLSPIKGMFGKKKEDVLAVDKEDQGTDEAQGETGPREMDDKTLARRHYKLFNTINEVTAKIEKLEGAKGQITEDRYQSLFDQYNGFLTKNAPQLQELVNEIDRRLIAYVEQKKEAAQQYAQLKKGMAQEEKLLKDGFISKEDYVEKVKSMRPREKSCADDYKELNKKITLLKDVKANKYIPEPDPIETDPSSMEGDGLCGDEKEGGAAESAGEKNLQKNETLYGKEVSFSFQSGVKLDVKISDIAIPVTSHWVGCDPNAYIQITPPSPYNTVKGKLVAGNALAFQGIYEGRRYRFSATIIEHLTKPIRAVILSYPDKLEIKDLRSSDRVSCRIPVTLFYRGKGKEGIIIDISPKGCGIDVQYAPQEKNYIIRTNETVKLECSFPGDPKHYPMNGIIRNVKKKQLHLIYGVQFADLAEDVKSVIARYITIAKK